MKVIRVLSSVWVFVIGFALLGALPSVAHAQAVEGEFTLRHQVRWGSLVLPAGRYAFTVESAGFPTRIFVHGEGKGAPRGMILAMSWDEIDSAKSSELVLVLKGGEFVVQSFYVPALGRVLNYLPRTKGSNSAPQQTAQARLTPSASVAK
jgi:hypothetical protein